MAIGLIRQRILKKIWVRLTSHMAVMKHAIFLLMEVYHADRVLDAVDPPLNIVHAFLLC